LHVSSGILNHPSSVMVFKAWRLPHHTDSGWDSALSSDFGHSKMFILFSVIHFLWCDPQLVLIEDNLAQCLPWNVGARASDSHRGGEMGLLGLSHITSLIRTDITFVFPNTLLRFFIVLFDSALPCSHLLKKSLQPRDRMWILWAGNETTASGGRYDIHQRIKANANKEGLMCHLSTS